MNLEARDIIAQAAGEHSRRFDYNHPAYGNCHCGLDPDDLPGRETFCDHQAQQILAALTSAGYAVVKLPEQMTDRSNVAEGLKTCPMWEVGRAWTCITDDGIEYEASGQNTYGTCDSAEARQLASVLLAAAAEAEK